MEARLQDEATLRDYLLGHLEDNPDLVEQIEEASLADTQLFETLDVIEDELIEEYLEGTLNTGDMQAVERHFLRPPERQRKLRNARLLSLHLSRVPAASERASVPSVRRFPDRAQAFRRLIPYRAFAEGAAAALLIAVTVSMLNLRRELQTEVRENEKQLEQGRQQTAALNHQLGLALKLAQPPTAMLSLLQPGIRRGDSELPELITGAKVKSIHVEIALASGAPGLYSVALEKSGSKLWSQDKLEAFTAHGGALLMFDLPAPVLRAGECKIVVRHSSGRETSYWFRVSDLQ